VRGQVILGLALVLLLAVVGALAGAWLLERFVLADAEPEIGRTRIDVTEPTVLDEPPARPDTVPDDAEAAIVDRVIDGDTVRVVAVPGGSIREGGSIRIRLLNIDTPERARDGAPAGCGAAEATARLEQLLGSGDLVWLVADREDRDRYDRPLRGLWTPNGTFVNEVLAEEGYAEVLLIEPNDRFHPRIEAAVERAQRAGRGIWGEPCLTPSP
jgi:micrococcal nuclease